MTPTPPAGPARVTVHAASQAETQYLTDAYDAEAAGEHIMLETGPWSLLMLIAAVRLAAAYPAMPAAERAVLLAYAGTWARVYAGTPAEDMAADGSMPFGIVVPGSVN